MQINGPAYGHTASEKWLAKEEIQKDQSDREGLKKTLTDFCELE